MSALPTVAVALAVAFVTAPPAALAPRPNAAFSPSPANAATPAGTPATPAAILAAAAPTGPFAASLAVGNGRATTPAVPPSAAHAIDPTVAAASAAPTTPAPRSPELREIEARLQKLFWARDLGAMEHELARVGLTIPAAAKDPEVLFWAEVFRFVTCQPLSKLEPDADPRRQLLRIETARLGRLGPDASTAETFWRDVLTSSFFGRTVAEPDGQQQLRWRIDPEVWPNEQLLVAPVPQSCRSAARSGATTEDLQWIAARHPAMLAALGPEYLPAATRLAYHRAARSYAAGKLTDAREALGFVDLQLLPAPLRPHARLLRLESGFGDPAEYLALAEDPALERARTAMVIRAAVFLAKSSDNTAALLKLTDEANLARLGLDDVGAVEGRYLLALRAGLLERSAPEDAAAQAARARLAERVLAHGAPAADTNGQLLEEFALAHLSTLPAERAIVTLDHLEPGTLLPTRLARVASFAMTMRRFDLVQLCAARLQASDDTRIRARGLALEAESALLQKDGPVFARATQALLDARNFAAAAIAERDVILIELLTALATHAAASDDPIWIGHVEDLFRDTLARLGRRIRPALDRANRMLVQAPGRVAPPPPPAPTKTAAKSAAAAAKEAPTPAKPTMAPLSSAVVALGAASIHPSHPAAQPPPVGFTFPEPFSLLALPAAAAAADDHRPPQVLAWFNLPDEPTHPEVPRAP